MENRKKMAILGIGRWGKNLVREFSKQADLEYCFHSGNKSNSDWLKKEYPKIKTAATYQEILDNASIPSVVIATPIKTHFELARKAILAGKNVFIEKPISESAVQADELIRLAKKKRTVIFVGHIFLYHDVFEKIKEIFSKEKIKSLNFSWQKLGSFTESMEMNLWCHDLAIALGLAGRPRGRIKKYSTGDVMIANGKFGRISVSFYINRVSTIKNKSIIIQTDKNIYNWTDTSLFMLKKPDMWENIFESKKTPLENEVGAFIEAISKGKKFPTDGEFGKKVIEIISKVVSAN